MYRTHTLSHNARTCTNKRTCSTRIRKRDRSSFVRLSVKTILSGKKNLNLWRHKLYDFYWCFLMWVSELDVCSDFYQRWLWRVSRSLSVFCFVCPPFIFHSKASKIAQFVTCDIGEKVRLIKHNWLQLRGGWHWVRFCDCYQPLSYLHWIMSINPTNYVWANKSWILG